MSYARRNLGRKRLSIYRRITDNQNAENYTTCQLQHLGIWVRQKELKMREGIPSRTVLTTKTYCPGTSTASIT